MRFSRKKLPQSAVAALRKVPVGFLRPYELTVAPIYFLLARNEKLVAIKGPLSFFTPEELEKLKAMESFYLPAFIDSVAPFQRAGESVRKLFGARQVHKINSSEGETTVAMPLAPHALSDAVLRILGPLWGKGARIEPFFLVFLASEVCQPIPRENIAVTFERDVSRLELGLLRSATSVFLALHVGFCDRAALTGLRDRVLSDAMEGRSAAGGASSELDQLAELAERLVPDADTPHVAAKDIAGLGTRVARKLSSRIERVRQEHLARRSDKTPDHTVFGPRGFRDE